MHTRLLVGVSHSERRSRVIMLNGKCLNYRPAHSNLGGVGNTKSGRDFFLVNAGAPSTLGAILSPAPCSRRRAPDWRVFRPLRNPNNARSKRPRRPPTAKTVKLNANALRVLDSRHLTREIGQCWWNGVLEMKGDSLAIRIPRTQRVLERSGQPSSAASFQRPFQHVRSYRIGVTSAQIFPTLRRTRSGRKRELEVRDR
jgi:hypothetical protein